MESKIIHNTLTTVKHHGLQAQTRYVSKLKGPAN